MIRDGALMRFAIIESERPSLTVTAAGKLAANEIERPAAVLAGCRCVYGLSQGKYIRRRVSLNESAGGDDREVLDWELGQACVEPLDRYRYEYIERVGTGAEAWLIDDRRVEQIADWFSKRQLMLDRLVFVPVAIAKAIRPLLSAEHAVFTYRHGSSMSVYLFKARRLLVCADLIAPSQNATGQDGWIDELGVLLMSHFGGRQTPREIEVIACGEFDVQSCAAALERRLPYTSRWRSLNAQALNIQVDCEEQFDIGEILPAIALGGLTAGAIRKESLQTEPSIGH